MEFAWTSEQLAIKERFAEFARTTLNDDLLERDKQSHFDRDLWRACAAFGVQGLCVPQAYGGLGYDVLTSTLALEGLGYGCRDNGLSFGLNASLWSVTAALLVAANADQMARYLPGLCSGDLIGAYAMTEKVAGSDAFHLTSSARKVEGGYVLDGHKCLITFAPVADFALVFATVDPDLGRWGLSLFCIDRGTQGFETGPVQEKMGLRSTPIGEIHLNGCFVPDANRIGEEGAGASIFNHSQEYERACILAWQLGAMERQLEAAVAYARERKQFGQPIGKFQAVSHRIADMKLRLEIARLLTYRAAWLLSVEKPAMLEASLANLYLGDAFVESSMDAIRIHGGRGYLTENEIERDLRDAAAGPVYGGTADIQRNIIARHLGL
jgi:alkylation response protein AidB-like acyl-CoA dehydrogenase